MAKEPLVAIIIPYYNAGETIHETMESVFAQSYRNYDVWIINDGSTDPSSLEALKQYENDPRVTILHQENAGPSVARNNAIKKSLAQFIIPLDSDDILIRSFIEQSLKVSENQDVIYGNAVYFGEKIGIKKQPIFNLQEIIYCNPIGVTALIRKDTITKYGFFDEHLSKLGLEDWELWIRLGKNGVKFKHIDFVLYKIRVNSASRTFEVANKNITDLKAYIFNKHIDVLLEEYSKLYIANREMKNLPDYIIGNVLLKPYRTIKKIFRFDGKIPESNN